MSQLMDMVRLPNAFLGLAKGQFDGCQPLNLFGFNRAVGTSYETIWNNSSVYVYPSSALTMSVVSSSGSDTMNVLIQGLDADYLEISDTITLTGTDAVTTSISFFRINSAVILSGNNVGNITISNGGTTYAYIEATSGLTQGLIFTVPANKKLYLYRLDFNSATTTGSKYLTIRNVQRLPNGRILKVSEATFAQSMISYDRQIPFKIDEKTDFQFEAKSSSSTNHIAAFIEGVLAED